MQKKLSQTLPRLSRCRLPPTTDRDAVPNQKVGNARNANEAKRGESIDDEASIAVQMTVILSPSRVPSVVVVGEKRSDASANAPKRCEEGMTSTNHACQQAARDMDTKKRKQLAMRYLLNTQRMLPNLPPPHPPGCSPLPRRRHHPKSKRRP